MKNRNFFSVFLCVSFVLHGLFLSDAALLMINMFRSETGGTHKTAKKKEKQDELIHVFFEEPVKDGATAFTENAFLTVAKTSRLKNENKKVSASHVMPKKPMLQTLTQTEMTQLAYNDEKAGGTPAVEEISDVKLPMAIPGKNADNPPEGGDENPGAPIGTDSGDDNTTALSGDNSAVPVSYKNPETDKDVPDEKELIASYLSKVRSKIISMKNYPAHLREKGMEGDVVLKVTLSSSGNVSGVNVHKSSGHGALDAHAKSIIYSLSPFPPFPAGVSRASLSVRVPLRFVIQ